MIVVRDIFQIKYGRAKEAVNLWKEGRAFFEKAGFHNNVRLLTDLVGQSYTLVLETTWESLTAYEASYAKMMSTGIYEEWRKWYDKYVPLVESGKREIFNIVD
jgi:hypothetical protein